jgi:hypothetical protein
MKPNEIAKAAGLEVTKCDPEEWGGKWQVKVCENGWSCGHESFYAAVKYAVTQNLEDGMSNLIWSALLSHNSPIHSQAKRS